MRDRAICVGCWLLMRLAALVEACRFQDVAVGLVVRANNLHWRHSSLWLQDREAERLQRVRSAGY